MGERYRLTADLPADASDQEVTQIRAQAIETALRHAATDHQFRAEMIQGETRSAFRGFVSRLAQTLKNEPEPVRKAVLDALSAEMKSMWEEFFPLRQVESLPDAG